MLNALAVEPLAIATRAHPDIKGLRMGQVTEVLSLFADDMLLYLEGAGPSLTAALHLIQQFGTFSGLQNNCSKSKILPTDVTAPAAAQAALPLVRTYKIKYLGVQCSRSLKDYMPLNLEPLYDLLKSKTQVWARLPLCVMGRINLIMMILLPKLLYLFWRARPYIPARVFKSMESILNMFVWGPSRHKLSWQTLKRPVHLGGTALPDLALYYIASQLLYLTSTTLTIKTSSGTPPWDVRLSPML